MNIILNKCGNIGFIVFLLCLIVMVFIVFARAYNKSVYSEIKKSYQTKYKIYPAALSRYENASLVTSATYLGNVFPIMKILLLPYNKRCGMEKEQVDFLKELPIRLTVGYKFEAILWFIQTMLLSVMIILVLQR